MIKKSYIPFLNNIIVSNCRGSIIYFNSDDPRSYDLSFLSRKLPEQCSSLFVYIIRDDVSLQRNRLFKLEQILSIWQNINFSTYVQSSTVRCSMILRRKSSSMMKFWLVLTVSLANQIERYLAIDTRGSVIEDFVLRTISRDRRNKRGLSAIGHDERLNTLAPRNQPIQSG